MSQTFETLILIGRPAAGKSEVIDFLKKTDLEQRRRRFHIGPFEEFDDFVYVWESFEIDDILEKHGRERLFTTPDYYFKDPFTWDLFIERLNLEFRKKLARDPHYLTDNTAIVEFARGGERGFAAALERLDPAILERAGLVYIDVSYAESVRKNRRRFRPERADSVLYHSLPDDKMEFYYRTNDWATLAGSATSGRIPVQGFQVPFAVFPNEPERTDDPAKLGPALEEVLGRLWAILHEAR